MPGLLFFSRVALICNIFSVLAAIIQFTNYFEDPALISTIAIIGFFLGVFIINPAVNFGVLIHFILRRKKPLNLPRWLMITNFIFLVLQVIYILYLNDFFN